jgi:hypothetical protein
MLEIDKLVLFQEPCASSIYPSCLVGMFHGTSGPLGELPNMRWCGETNRYYAIRIEHGNDLPSNTSTVSKHEIECVINRPVDPKIVDTLPTSNSRKRGRAHSAECCICYRNLVHHTLDPRMRFVSLPCNHSFHLYCVGEWLTKRRGSCPLCRKPVDTSLNTAAGSIGIE